MAQDPIDPRPEGDDGTWHQPAQDDSTLRPGTGSQANSGTSGPKDEPEAPPPTVPADEPTMPPAETSAAKVPGDARDSRDSDEVTPRSDSPPTQDWARLPAPKIEEGQVLFGKFLLEKKIGEGGMGEVWLVENINIQRESALKLIKPEIAANDKGWRRFEREARLMAKITHPNAVVIYDFMRTHSMGYIEMEFVKGQSLDRILRDRGDQPMPLEWTADILDQLCSVLQDAHGYFDEKKGRPKPIIHRDLKPSNLMLLDRKPAGQNLKVLDFGIAKMAEDEGSPELTGAGDLLGTPAFMSPEQIRGGITREGRGEIDGRSDLYSVGVLLYQMLTGVMPFRGMSKMALLAAHLNATPPPMREANPAADVPPVVERLVMRCLEKEPDRRPQSARELAEQFRAAVRESIGEVPARPALRIPSPRLVGLAGLVLAASLTAGALAVRYRGRTPVKTGPDPDVVTNNSVVVEKPARTATKKAATTIEGYEPLDAEALSADAHEHNYAWDPSLVDRDARPAGLRRNADGSVYYGFAPGIYLPRGYQPADRTDTINFWPRVLVRSKDGARFLRIPGGTYSQGDFRQGSPTTDLQNQPLLRHKVEISGFYIQETEVTNGEIVQFLKDHSDDQSKLERWNLGRTTLSQVSNPKLPDEQVNQCPAVFMSRMMAQRYAGTVGGRLPTEAEWEYTARSLGKDNLWAWKRVNGQNMGPKAHLLGNNPFPVPVTTFKGHDETEQQVLDMTGNVREWCLDAYEPYEKVIAETAPNGEASRDPRIGDEPGTKDAKVHYVVRGGSCLMAADDAMTFQRNGVAAEEENPDLGFRVVLECPPDLVAGK
jgi:serine/threonine-protein kinase